MQSKRRRRYGLVQVKGGHILYQNLRRPQKWDSQSKRRPRCGLVLVKGTYSLSKLKMTARVVIAVKKKA